VYKVKWNLDTQYLWGSLTKVDSTVSAFKYVSCLRDTIYQDFILLCTRLLYKKLSMFHYWNLLHHT